MYNSCFYFPFLSRLCLFGFKNAKIITTIFWLKKFNVGFKNLEFDADFKFVEKVAQKIMQQKLSMKK
jgi:hypothetical protein